MKKIRVFLGAFAFAVAIGGAYATSLMPVTGWVYVSGACQSSSKNCSGSGPTCKDAQDRIIYDSNTVSGTTCGTALLHTN